MSKCEINRTTVQNGIENSIDNQLDGSGFFTKEGDLYVPVEGTDFAPIINDINDSFGESMVMPAFQETDGFLVAEPSEKMIDKYLGSVNYTFSSINILQSPNAVAVFEKGTKNKWSLDKILTELQVPSIQKDLIKSLNTSDREEIISSLLADYAYAVEINTARDESLRKSTPQGNYHDMFTDEELDEPTPTAYYSSMTVPGGTNYTENEIATPGITPSIKGHAQFATDQGIGWFRSDEAIETQADRDKVEVEEKLLQEAIESGGAEPGMRSLLLNTGEGSRTRRILEVQSDLFQKGRDRENLIQSESQYPSEAESVVYPESDEEIKEYEKLGYENTGRVSDDGFPEYAKFKITAKTKNDFLQLLNKANNWVTFFVKSIIQDSTKKGYEKVLFPAGATAAKVEGHQTVEGFIEYREKAIKEYNEKINELKNKKYKTPSTRYVHPTDDFKITKNPDRSILKVENAGTTYNIEIEEVNDKGFPKTVTLVNSVDSNDRITNLSYNEFYTTPDRIRGEIEQKYSRYRVYTEKDLEEDKKKDNSTIESAERNITQFEKELADAKAGKLKISSIAKFYEETVFNVLKKQGYGPKRITDEFGNDWYEVNSEVTPDQIFLSADPTPVITTEEEDQIEELQKAGLLSRSSYIEDGIQYFEVPMMEKSKNVQAVRRLESYIHNNKINFLEVQDLGDKYIVKLQRFKPILRGTELESSVSSKATTVTKNRVLRFLENIGFNSIESVSELVYKGQKIKGYAYTDLANGIMQIVEGKEDYTLPEEAMHILVALVKESRPELYSRMMKEITNYKMYSTVLNDPAYYQNKLYQTEDGEIDYNKIKEEAVAKILAENLINELENTTESAKRMEEVRNWWRTIKLWIQELFGKYKNPFRETLEQLENSDTAFGEFIDLDSDAIFLSAQSTEQVDAKNPQNKAIFESVRDRPSELGITKIVNDEENAYYKDGVKVGPGKRISDKVSAFYKRIFGNRGFDEALRDFYETSRKDGEHLHEIMEEVINSYIDPQTGLKKPNPTTVQFPLEGIPIAPAIAKDVQKYLKSLMASYPPGTRFLTERVIYDRVNDLYGTIDFMAIQPDGTVDILDWKSMLLPDIEGAKDYKKDAIFIQLGEYARILKEEYGVEKFGKIRAIPIRKTYSQAVDPKNRKLISVDIGNVQAGKIGVQERYIRPIISPLESTGSPERDELIQKLTALYQDYVNKGYFRDQKEILTHVQEAIYEIRVTNSVDNLANYFIDFRTELSELMASKKDILDKADKEEISEVLATLSFFENIIQYVVAPAAQLTEDATIETASRTKLEGVVNKLALQKTKIEELRKELLNKRAEKDGIFGLLLPEKVVSLLRRWFRSLGSQNVATLRYMYELTKQAYSKIDVSTDEELTKLRGLKTEFDSWRTAKGLDKKEAIGMLVDFEKGKIHSKIDKTFFEAREAAQTSRDPKTILKFVNENYNLEEYEKWYVEELAALKERHAKTTYDTDKAKDRKAKAKAILTFESNYNLKKHPITAFGYHNKRVWNIKNLKEEKWYSEAYTKLQAPGNETALAMYDYMIAQNKKLAEVGGIEEHKAYSFLPNVRKTFADVIDIDDTSSLEKVTDLVIKQYTDFRASVSIDDYTYTFQGARDPYTGEKLEKRYIPYVAPIDDEFKLKVDTAIKLGVINKGDSTEKLNEKINAYKAASPANAQAFEKEMTNSREMSFDIFAMYGLMAKEISKEQYLTKNDEIIRALNHYEKSKPTLLQNKYGKLDLDANGVPKVSTQVGLNSKLTEEHMKAIVNGEKIQFDADFVVQFKIREKWNRSPLGKLHQFDVDPKTYEPTAISATKFLLWLNSANQKRILGVNLASAFSNLFGGTYASNKLYQKYLSKDDLHKSWMKLTSGGFYNTEDMKKNAALVDYFLPLLQNREDFKASQLSINQASTILSQDWLMAPMRKTSEIVQLNIFLALIENSALVNGEIVNIRDAVRKELNYDSRYSLPIEEREKVEKEFDAKIKTMKEQFGLVKMSQFKTIKENGKDKTVIEIPGIDRNSESFYNLREISQTMSKDALGEADEFDIANYKYAIIGRLMMTFKNWIPRQADVRFGEFRYDQSHHAYEYGRFRMFYRSLMGNLGQSIVKIFPLPVVTKKITDAVFTKEGIIQKAKETYQQKLKAEKVLGRYNKDTFITEGEFIDKFIEGSEATFAEIRTLLFMMAVLVSGIAAPDDDDDPETKAVKALITKQGEKLIDEVGFFYSPKSGIDILGTGAPVFSIVRDGWNLGKDVGKEFFGLAMDGIGFDEFGEPIYESAKPIKRTFKMFPVLKEVLTYLPAVDSEVAKEWGVTISTRRSF